MRETVPKIGVMSERVIREEGRHCWATFRSVKNQNQNSNVYWNGLLKENRRQQEELLGDGHLKQQQQLNNPFFAGDCLGSSLQLENAEQKPKEAAVWADENKAESTNVTGWATLEAGCSCQRGMAQRRHKGQEPGIINAERAH